MKKAILVFAALLMVVSGVAAVSAYEAHVVDIKAHVENALGVPYEADFGTVFPQEVVELNIHFGVSNSFCDASQMRVSDLHYAIYWEDKPIKEGCVDADNDTFFEPLYPWLVLSDGDPGDGNDGLSSSNMTPGWVPAAAVAWGELFKIIPEPAAGKTGDLCDYWHLTFSVPVFDKWYNPTTDPIQPSGQLIYDDQDYYIVTENVCGQMVEVPHADLGSNLKIQIINFSYHTG